MAPEDGRPGPEQPGSHQPDDDAVWEQLVASFHASGEEPVDRVRTPGDDGAEPPAEAAPPPPPAAPEQAQRDPHDHFVPPPPPPIPRGDRVSRTAWAAVLGAPLLLVITALLGRHLSSWQAGLLVGAFLAGFATLVARMRTRDPYDPDDGAVV